MFSVEEFSRKIFNLDIGNGTKGMLSITGTTGRQEHKTKIIFDQRKWSAVRGSKSREPSS